MDLLSEILQIVQLSGSIWCTTEARAPWGMKIGRMNHAHFHFVRRGNCVFQMEGMSEPVVLSGGDLILLPQGHEHILADRFGTVTVPIEKLITDHKQEGHGVLQIGGQGMAATLICGYWQFDRSSVHPLLSALPDFIHIKGEDEMAGSWLETTLDWICRESVSGNPGADVVITRLVEILFIQILRIHIARLNDEDKGSLRGLRDPQITKALGCIHAEPGHSWTVDSLSTAVGMSRASFAGRFKQIVGESPYQYLTRWRMIKASVYLRAPNASLADVAEMVGYQNESAFSKVFKRYLGVSPGGYRRNAVFQQPAQSIQ